MRARWPDILIPIPGARVLDHALDSLSAADVHFSPSELAAFDAALSRPKKRRRSK